MRHAINVLRILSDPRIVIPPLRAYRKAAKRGLTSAWRERFRALEFVRRWLRRERLIRHGGRWAVYSFLPAFPSTAFRRAFENLSSDDWVRPLSAFVAITADCPADCWHCSVKNRRMENRLGREQWLDVIGDLNRLGTSIIGITGGEPLTQPYLPELVQAAAQGGAEVQLFTSGIGLTEEMCRSLREAGLWAMGVSLDHTSAEVVNEKRRTPVAFEAAMSALEIARDFGFYTFINAVADRQMVLAGEYRRLYDLAARLKLQELRLIEPMPCGRLTDRGHDALLRPEEVETVRRFHRETNRRGRGPKVCAFNEVESRELFGCSAGFQHLYIDPAGAVCPCDFTPLSFGNVQEEPLTDIWARMNGAMRQPRCGCFIQNQAVLLRKYHESSDFPLPSQVSLHILSEVCGEPLPDYYRKVTKPFGFPSL
jgi:MoaA/NifB/PqqE/SkfB family radical SAM enzyme